MKKTTFCFAAICLLFCFSCKKENPQPSQPKNSPESMTKALVSNSWKLARSTANGHDLTELLGECYMDQHMTFDANGTCKLSNGILKCPPDLRDSAENIPWRFDSTLTRLIINETLDYAITFTLEGMKLEHQYTDSTGSFLYVNYWVRE